MNADLLRQRLATMLLIRRFEERCAQLAHAGPLRGLPGPDRGGEAVAAGIVPCLGPADTLVGCHGERGLALSRGIDARSLMAEMLGKAQGCNRGRGGGSLLWYAAGRVLGGTTIAGSGLSLAVGLSLADRSAGRDAVTACVFRDDTEIHPRLQESLQMAALWRLPVLYCGITQGEASIPVPPGSPSWPVDGSSVQAVEQAMRHALEAVRDGEPALLQIETRLLPAHSGEEPDRTELQEWKEHDPIANLCQQLCLRLDLDGEQLAAMEAAVAARLDDAVAFAEAGTIESFSDLSRSVELAAAAAGGL